MATINIGIENKENGYIEIKGTGTLFRNGVKIGDNVINYKDFTVEAGATYVYKLGNTTYDGVKLYFDDMFLSDKDHQLKIKFNPQVSTFKKTILEQKVDTIGSKYPFIFRNNQINYKEIAISGLVSHEMDDIGSFGIYSKDYSLTAENYYNERKFREAVYDWLTNGKPKLFRSPQEGNCVVQFMNVNLSPNTQLGRLLYTFSATGYEIMDCDIKTMISHDVMLGDKEEVAL